MMAAVVGFYGSMHFTTELSISPCLIRAYFSYCRDNAAAEQIQNTRDDEIYRGLRTAVERG